MDSTILYLLLSKLFSSLHYCFNALFFIFCRFERLYDKIWLYCWGSNNFWLWKHANSNSYWELLFNTTSWNDFNLSISQYFKHKMPDSFHITFIRLFNHSIYGFSILLFDIQHDENFTRQQVRLRRLIPHFIKVNRDRGSWSSNNHPNSTYFNQLLVQLQPF